MSSHKKFTEIANALPDCVLGKMFGKECIKSSNGKTLAIFFEEDMVFKLIDDAADDALSLDGSHIFEPSQGRKMNGWIQVPADYIDQWDSFAEAARAYVASLPANKKKK